MKILSLTFHVGTAFEIISFFKNTSYQVTTRVPFWHHEGDIYSFSESRIGKITSDDKIKEFVNSFDLIVISDIMPICRMFARGDFDPKVLIWVCNRFDTFHCENQEYYEEVKNILKCPKFAIASMTNFEIAYAKKYRKIQLPSDVVKPTGFRDTRNDVDDIREISKFYKPFQLEPCDDISPCKSLLLVSPYYNEGKTNVVKILLDNGISHWQPPKMYGGPTTLRGFARMLHIPYTPSNITLWENAANGIVQYIPDKKFMLELYLKHRCLFQATMTNFGIEGISDPLSHEIMDESEWWCKKNSDLFVYFSSWEDLKKKLKEDVSNKIEKINTFMRKHADEQEKGFLKITKELLENAAALG